MCACASSAAPCQPHTRRPSASACEPSPLTPHPSSRLAGRRRRDPAAKVAAGAGGGGGARPHHSRVSCCHSCCGGAADLRWLRPAPDPRSVAACPTPAACPSQAAWPCLCLPLQQHNQVHQNDRKQARAPLALPCLQLGCPQRWLLLWQALSGWPPPHACPYAVQQLWERVFDPAGLRLAALPANAPAAAAHAGTPPLAARECMPARRVPCCCAPPAPRGSNQRPPALPASIPPPPLPPQNLLYDLSQTAIPFDRMDASALSLHLCACCIHEFCISCAARELAAAGACVGWGRAAVMASPGTCLPACLPAQAPALHSLHRFTRPLPAPACAIDCRLRGGAAPLVCGLTLLVHALHRPHQLDLRRHHLLPAVVGGWQPPPLGAHTYCLRACLPASLHPPPCMRCRWVPLPLWPPAPSRFVYGARSPERQALFQTGWFTLGLLTQTLIVHLIRTERLPFVQEVSGGSAGWAAGLLVRCRARSSCARVSLRRPAGCACPHAAWPAFAPAAAGGGLAGGGGDAAHLRSAPQRASGGC